MLRNSFPSFPEGTVHIIGIDTNPTETTPHVMVKYHKQYFIGTDNGIFSLISQEKPEKIFYLEFHQASNSFTFPAKDLFCRAAAIILNNEPIENLGVEAETIRNLQSFQPMITQNQIRAKVIHIDRYQNLITNLDQQTFIKHRKKRKFQIHFNMRKFIIERISDFYSDVSEPEVLAIFGTSGFLEIALNKGKAAELLGMQLDSDVIIDFCEVLF